MIKGEINKANVEWLQGSLVGELFKPINLSSLSSSLLEGGRRVVELRAMGSFMALVTFETRNDMEEAL